MEQLLSGAELRIEYRRVCDLVPYARNSRTHSDDQVAAIAASIREFGFNNPVLIDADGTIIAGHGRVMAAQLIGMDSVPIIILGHLTPEQRRAYVIADNKLSELGGWNADILAAEVHALMHAGFNLGELGFDDKELAAMVIDEIGEGKTDPDDVPDLVVDEPPITRSGDIWILGNHRLMCGDSTRQDDIARLVEHHPVAAVWTDPPYNVDYQGGNGQKILNDKMAGDKFLSFLTDAFSAICTHTRPGGAIYIAHADGEGRNFREAMIASGFMLKQCLIWVKNTFTLSRQDYQWQHEPILYGWKPGAAHIWYGDRDKRTVYDDQRDPAYMTQAELIDLVNAWRSSIPTSVIRESKPKRNDDHPTMKPVALIIRMLKNSTTIGDTVADIFGGSGSTLIACEKTARHARLMELDPRYCDVIIKRWQAFTGRVARLVDGQSYDEVVSHRLRGAA